MSFRLSIHRGLSIHSVLAMNSIHLIALGTHVMVKNVTNMRQCAVRVVHACLVRLTTSGPLRTTILHAVSLRSQLAIKVTQIPATWLVGLKRMPSSTLLAKHIVMALLTGKAYWVALFSVETRLSFSALRGPDMVVSSEERRRITTTASLNRTESPSWQNAHLCSYSPSEDFLFA